jgi:activator of HSP90 ATPase
MSRTIRQTVTFKAAPHQVYDALMDSQRHTEFTGDAARISREVGGEIMAYGGYITGQNVELLPDTKIVQTWRASDWPAGHESRVVFVLSPVPSGTRLQFAHRGVPDDEYESIKQGWIDYYWTPMKALFDRDK